MDQYIINKLQDGYDYLWNNYGTTKGTISMFLLVPVGVRAVIGLLTADWFCILLILFVLVYLYRAKEQHEHQINGQFNILNNEALETQTKTYDIIFRYIMLTLLVISVCTVLFSNGSVLTMIYGIGLTVYFYLLTTMVRARKLPESRFAFSNGI